MRYRRVGTSNRLISIGVACFIIVWGLLGFITFESNIVSAGSTIYVGSGLGNDTASIQDAIDNFASPGDTVFVHSGTYYENVKVNKTISLIGEDRDTTIINASGSEDAVEITADWVNITGFTTTGSGEVWGDAGINLNYVQKCRVWNNVGMDSKYGIFLYYSDNNTLENNFVHQNLNPIWGNGFYFYCSSWNTLTGNNASYNHNGIFATHDFNFNTIVNNMFYKNSVGTHIQYSSDNSVISNTFLSNTQHSLTIEDEGGNTIYHNRFIDNNGGGVQARDSIGGNNWNDFYPSGGNYWNDWTSPDMMMGPNQDLPGCDGFVDFPYFLDGGVGEFDRYPIADPVLDLEVTASDINFDPSSPVRNGTLVFINATIHNGGASAAKGVVVRFFHGNPNDPGSFQIGSDQFIPSIASGGNETVGVQWNAGPIGTHEIFVVADPDDMITETDESNNNASKAIDVIDIQPPILYVKAVGDDIILNWTHPFITGISHYLLYRAPSQTEFDFSNVWVNTSQHDDNGTIPLRTTWNDTGAASGMASQEFYYVIRTVSNSGEISFTSRTVGKWTKAFYPGVSTFSLPLEPLAALSTDDLASAMNATYIKWMNTTTHTWTQHNLGYSGINNTQMKMGEGYEVKFSNHTNFTFTGMPGAMIIYDDNILFPGFAPDSEAKNLTVAVEPDGNVTLSWQEPVSMGGGDWYEVYYSNKRDGFFGTLGIQYFLACPSIGFGMNTTTIAGLGADNPGTRLYFMVVPFNSGGLRGAGTYSIGIWTEEYLAEYDTFGIPLKMSLNYSVDWYCDNIPDSIGMNYFISSEQRWEWHSTRMSEGAYDPQLIMMEGYQISTANATRFTFIGI